MSDDVAFRNLYTLRDRNNQLFVKAWRRLKELDPEFWANYQTQISINDAEITEVMSKLCE